MGVLKGSKPVEDDMQDGTKQCVSSRNHFRILYIDCNAAQ